ncbi:hypothetical protein EAL2_c19920 [Peptoclostridium acidaminophilum DSM 3953]|uniref:Uncharacterized protein n=1 Tax=Peptoclostridium acidaminophilum DSM 3953 TaxID=1286171 RepID=W8THG8_PEPAC|nr:hypothetical protein [Peptoclostridium acidaminophilum]AHM57273.1 hypothetical protein EAL2_c19920 [Peptoclostridium acidaminophilum DSM 3953]
MIDRATYKQLKHYSKLQMERFLTEYYLNAAEDALDSFIERLKTEKGIGPRTREKIEKIRSEVFSHGGGRHDRAKPD